MMIVYLFYWLDVIFLINKIILKIKKNNYQYIYHRINTKQTCLYWKTVVINKKKTQTVFFSGECVKTKVLKNENISSLVSFLF